MLPQERRLSMSPVKMQVVQQGGCILTTCLVVIPMVLLGVSQLKPGFYESHPMYDERIHALDPRIKYGYCAYSTSDQSIFKECLGSYPTTIRINECSAKRLKQSDLLLEELLDANALNKWIKSRDNYAQFHIRELKKEVSIIRWYLVVDIDLTRHFLKN